MWLSQEFGEWTHDVFDHLDASGEDQGFLDESGQYLTRKQALASALMNGQVKDPSAVRCGMLFSEDLW